MEWLRVFQIAQWFPKLPIIIWMPVTTHLHHPIARRETTTTKNAINCPTNHATVIRGLKLPEEYFVTNKHKFLIDYFNVILVKGLQYLYCIEILLKLVAL